LSSHFSSIPIFVAVFDKILPADALAANPQVYAPSSKMLYYSHLSYVGAMIEALWHAIVQFCFLYFCYRESTGGDSTTYFHTSIDLAQFSQLSVLLSVVAGFFSFALGKIRFKLKEAGMKCFRYLRIQLDNLVGVFSLCGADYLHRLHLQHCYNKSYAHLQFLQASFCSWCSLPSE
jgi:hypothetical protein